MNFTGAEPEGINCNIHILEGESHDVRKEEYIRKLGAENVVALGNGNNDRKMLKSRKDRHSGMLKGGVRDRCRHFSGYTDNLDD